MIVCIMLCQVADGHLVIMPCVQQVVSLQLEVRLLHPIAQMGAQILVVPLVQQIVVLVAGMQREPEVLVYNGGADGGLVGLLDDRAAADAPLGV